MTTAPAALLVRRDTIYESRRPSDITAEIASLERAYLKSRKRGLPGGISLFMSSRGDPTKSIYGLTVYSTPDTSDDVAFLRGATSKSPLVAAQPVAARV